ncbi:aldose epimerase family protein [Phyllobacterium myrsinacearum]|uniref:Aldose 1-epimerase n=1 Tax=Phyllobacterium myrsinacearum TaxID=28101 RepID=A0A2S9JXN5_9HYPH|nr:aldose epimerase family protein [Phyllobacterium myrsinacearum]PRD58097.1 galactose-1-epimerase [Phyllobacterium myrsinacearum]PWV96290.1 aldose 1-epimerase [Phyllobacterium myrsinacearum]RZV09720.1 aldose 1-epimerase [Phyllobacterium myrsinacearum]
MHTEIFGHTPDGEAVHRITISGGGLTAKILTWGAVIQDLRLKDHDHPLVLGYRDFADYPAHSPYLGATIGRTVNRIRDGELVIDGQTFALQRNFHGIHNIHGGDAGAGRRTWNVVAVGPDYVTLTIMLGDGEMGFPGNLTITCTYMLESKGTLAIRLDAVTDKPTICNLAHHSYFNLDDGGLTDVLDHQVKIGAEAYLAVNGDLLPDGRVLPVAGTAHDFRAYRTIRREEDGRQVVYDNNFCVSSQRRPLQWVASAKGARSNIEMQVLTTEPGVQFYAANTLGGRPPLGLTGQTYANYAGFCFEAQNWPDSTHFPYFPQSILRPDDTYSQMTRYTFRKHKV